MYPYDILLLYIIWFVYIGDVEQKYDTVAELDTCTHVYFPLSPARFSSKTSFPIYRFGLPFLEN